MLAFPLPLRTADDAARLVRALGKHRYVAGRVILVHALAADLDDDSEMARWAASVLANPDVDSASRDERLLRHATEEELAAVLAAYWGEDGVHRERLAMRLAELELDVGEGAPFDESLEDDIHPVLVDAGWELLPLASLDSERHKGAIGAYGDPIYFESARFEEENAIPKTVHLQELPLLGPVELLRAAQSGVLVEEPVLWLGGDETYQDYVVRGALRAAKLG